MRFTWNAFIVSTVSLVLSLITPVVNAVDVAVMNSPSAGQILYAYQSVDVTWTITSAQRIDDVKVEVALMKPSDEPSYSPILDTLKDNVSLLSGQATVQIGNTADTNFYMALIVRNPPDPNNVSYYAKGGPFTIA